MGRNFNTLISLVAVLGFAAIVLFTGTKLYQLRNDPISPTAPDTPSAQESTNTISSCQTTAFNIGTQLVISPSPSSSPSPAPIAETTTTSPTPTLTAQPLANVIVTPTPNPTPTQTPAAVVPNPTKTPTPSISPTPLPELPRAGNSLPTILGMTLAALAILGALAIAL